MSNRWEPFTEAELREIWRSLVEDDGLIYAPALDDEPLFSLVQEVAAEGRRRGLWLEGHDRVIGA